MTHSNNYAIEPDLFLARLRNGRVSWIPWQGGLPCLDQSMILFMFVTPFSGRLEAIWWDRIPKVWNKFAGDQIVDVPTCTNFIQLWSGDSMWLWGGVVIHHGLDKGHKGEEHSAVVVSHCRKKRQIYSPEHQMCEVEGLNNSTWTPTWPKREHPTWAEASIPICCSTAFCHLSSSARCDTRNWTARSSPLLLSDP